MQSVLITLREMRRSADRSLDIVIDDAAASVIVCFRVLKHKSEAFISCCSVVACMCALFKPEYLHNCSLCHFLSKVNIC